MLDMNDPQAKAAALASRLATELKAAADEYPPVIASHAFVMALRKTLAQQPASMRAKLLALLQRELALCPLQA
jgi:hypothetical protein